ncbi:MAG: zinc ribbon domain-containing protein [Deltaproteobacteria bacterium]|nr:zinc ribbon domain-containing protein [Deltaproteobacteria bacterium]
MPIYEYQCKKCGCRVEVFQKFSDSPLTQCEKCNGKVKKLISQSSFHLKGTGWYVTDYASKGGGRDGKKKDKDSTPKEVKGSVTKETKSESVSPAKEAKAQS